MSVKQKPNYGDTIHEAGNSFVTTGKLGPANMVCLTDTGGGGLISIRGEKTNITSVIGETGAGFTTIVKVPSGLGDGKSPPDNERGTKHYASGTGKTDRRVITMLKNPNGAGITIDGCGGSADTISMMTANGKNGIVITENRIALWTNGTEVVLYGLGGGQKVTSTYALVLEPNPGSGQKVQSKTAVG